MTYLIRHSNRGHYHLPHGVVEHTDHAHNMISAIAQTIWISTGVVIELLAIRFMLAFLGANPQQTIFHFIYSISQPLVQPFENIINQSYPTGSFYRFEAFTLIAIAVYAIIGYGLAKMLSPDDIEIE